MDNTNSMSDSKIAVITGMSYLDVDRIIATIVLAKALANKHSSPVDISLGYPLNTSLVERIVETKNVQIVQNMTLAQRMLTLENISQEVADIKWKQANGKIDLELLNANGERIDPSNTSLDFKSSKYQKAFTVGVRSSNYLLRLLTNTTAEDLKTVNLHSIDVVNKKDFGFSADRFINDQVHSLSAAVFNYCLANEIKLGKTEHTELLAGIYWKTNSLRNYYTTPNTLQVVQQLLAAGASLQQANARIFGQLSRETQVLWQELLGNQTVKENVLTTSTQKQHDYEKLLNNTILPIFIPQFFANVKLSVIALPITDNKTMILASSLMPEVNLHKLLRDLNPKGDDLQVKILLEDNTNAALDRVVSLVSKATGPANPTDTKTNNPATEPESKTVASQESKADTVKTTTQLTQTKKPAAEVNSEDTDPLAPAQIDFKELAGKSEDENNDSNPSPFGLGGSSDPLPPPKN